MAQDLSEQPSPSARVAPRRHPVQSLATSADGEGFIKSWEGLPGSGEPALRTYRDVAGHPTIGWGHRLARPDQYPDGVSRDHAQELFDADRRYPEALVRKAVRVPLAQHEFDALVSLAYNVPKALDENYNGPGVPTKLLERLNAGDYEGAARQIPAWNKARKDGRLAPDGGLTRRRGREQVIFGGGPYQGP